MLRLILVASLLVGTYAGVPYALRPSVESIKLPQDERIVGGYETTIENVPYIVALVSSSSGRHRCGGSIIRDDTILTAAHCLTVPPSLLSIRAGSTYKSSGGQVIPVRSYINHPSYGTILYAYDIAVMKLTSSITTATPAMIIQMIGQDLRFPDGSMARTSGWGTTGFGSSAFPEALHTVLVPTVSNAVCNQAYDEDITSDMLCAGYMGTGGKDACSMDSGGPLMFNNILIGVVSWGERCALATHPGVYADVGYFRNWIESVI